MLTHCGASRPISAHSPMYSYNNECDCIRNLISTSIGTRQLQCTQPHPNTPQRCDIHGRALGVLQKEEEKIEWKHTVGRAAEYMLDGSDGAYSECRSSCSSRWWQTTTRLPHVERCAQMICCRMWHKDFKYNALRIFCFFFLFIHLHFIGRKVEEERFVVSNLFL